MVRLKIRLDPNYQKLAWFPRQKNSTPLPVTPLGQDAKMWITPNATTAGAGAGCGTRSIGEEIAVEWV